MVWSELTISLLSPAWPTREWAGKLWRSPSMVSSTKSTYPTSPISSRSCSRRTLWGAGKPWLHNGHFTHSFDPGLPHFSAPQSHFLIKLSFKDMKERLFVLLHSTAVCSCNQCRPSWDWAVKKQPSVVGVGWSGPERTRRGEAHYMHDGQIEANSSIFWFPFSKPKGNISEKSISPHQGRDTVMHLCMHALCTWVWFLNPLETGSLFGFG